MKKKKTKIIILNFNITVHNLEIKDSMQSIFHSQTNNVLWIFDFTFIFRFL